MTDNALEGLIPLRPIGFQEGLNQPIFDCPHQNVSVNPVFLIFIGLRGLPQAFVCLDLCAFLDDGGQITEKGCCGKILFDLHRRMAGKVFDFKFVRNCLGTPTPFRQKISGNNTTR